MTRIRFLTKNELPKQESGLSITQILREHLTAPVQKRGYNNIHASDLTKQDYCPRKVVLWRQAGCPVEKERLDALLSLTFKMGKITADLITNELGGNAVWGNWKCNHCRSFITYSRKPDPCSCDPDAEWLYKEIAFIHEETGASGSIDALFDLATGKFTLAELKIVSPDEFEKLKMPLWEHSSRTKLYLEIIANSNNILKNVIDLTQARVLYTCRSHGKKVNGRITAWKEYIVKADSKEVAPYLAKARQIKMFEATGKYPPPLCDTPTSINACKCEFREQCEKIGGFAL